MEMDPHGNMNLNLEGLLQVLLVASLGQIVSQTLSTFSTQEEREEGTKIGTLSGTISPPYHMLGETYVRVDEKTGDVYTTGLRMDRESLCPLQLDGYCIILANVLVGPGQDVVKISVVVEDVNDNAPYFETDIIKLRIPEDVTVGTRLPLDEVARDEDIGSNAEISYRLEGAQGFFSLAQDALVLIIERGLDREAQEEHCMVLVAVDGGSVPLSATVTVVVTVLDVDDNCPQFSPLNATVPGGATSGTTVAQIHAVDRDLVGNAQITYSFSPLISERAKFLFQLDKTTGRISLSTDVTSDSLEEHVLKVVASSPPCPVEQTQVTIFLQPVENPEPDVEIMFLAELKDGAIMLRENEPPTVLALLKPRDGAEDQVVLSLEDGSVEFSLKPQAGGYLLSTSKPLDFERRRSYEVTVALREARGKPAFGRKVIRVAVEDVNDNVPRFSESRYHVEIEENNNPAPLIRVRADDPDSELYGKVTYRLIGGVDENFSVNQATGVLSVLQPLDREERDAYVLTVLARDHGSPPLEARSYVSVKILDQNDNRPTFVAPHFSFFVSESIPRLAPVGKIAVMDPDEGDNGTVVDIQVVGQDVPFAFDLSQSVLRCTGEVDREKRDRYDLLLRAVDAGRPRLSSTASVTVFIEDVNDNQPKVIRPSSNLSCTTVSPNTMVGSVITKIYAIDHDSGLNSDITYRIVATKPAQPSPFQIDPRSGNIVLVQRLVMADYGMHQLFVVVSDRGKPAPLQAAVWVNVLINETSRECNLTDVPQDLPLASEPPIGLNSSNKPEPRCPKQSWITLLCGLGLLGFSAVVLLVAIVIFLRQRKRTSAERHELTPLN